jgi:hypothetical protein
VVLSEISVASSVVQVHGNIAGSVADVTSGHVTSVPVISGHVTSGHVTSGHVTSVGLVNSGHCVISSVGFVVSAVYVVSSVEHDHGNIVVSVVPAGEII